MTVDFVAGALAYAERLKWPVFPLAPGLKVPFFAKDRGGNGVHDATTDPDQIRAWGKICPAANIGIACGSITVVDVDPRNGGDVSLAALAAKGCVLPLCPRQRTGNGGWHYVFAGDPRIANSKGRLGRGIEIKSAGGYIVGAPSWTKASSSGPGGRYRWEVSPFDVAAPLMPAWLVDRLLPPPRKPVASCRLPSLADAEGYRRMAVAVLRKVVREMGSLRDGRHVRPFDAARWLAKYVARGLLSEEEVRDAILQGCAANGALARYGARDIEGQIRRGLEHRARHDDLPPLRSR
jgi:hypothetical protein